ncbi:MAG: hypothetical protein ACR2MM_06425 [Flavobacteriaceae bacterium]
MMRRTLTYLGCLLFVLRIAAQQKQVRVVEQDITNRIALYAVNENEQDLDVKITISGTDFRQSRAKPRFIRVPAASKVHLKTIVLIRGKVPKYSYKLEVNDSLSNRALKREYEPIKIKPEKPIVLYLPPNCQNCDSLIVAMNNSKYLYNSYDLAEMPKIKDQLQTAFGADTPIDSLSTPILNVGGKLYSQIENLEQILEALNKE